MVLHLVMCILCNFFNGAQMPELMQGVGLACVTILIPVSIALLFPADKSDAFFDWEKGVILDRVIGSRKLLLALIFLFAPSFLWSNNHCLLNALLFLFFIGGAWLFFRVLRRVYNWISHFKSTGPDICDDYRHQLIKEYLRGIKDLREVKSVWSETWGKKNDNIYLAQDFIKIFIKKVDELSGQESLVEFLLQIFNTNFQNRIFGTLKIFEIFWEEVLLWKMKYNEQPMIGLHLDSLIKKMVIFSLTHGSYSKVLFDVLQKKVGDQEAAGERIITYVAPAFFDNVAKVENGNFVWSDYFPKKWKATYENLSDENNFMANIWYNEFIKWAKNRLYDAQEKFGKDGYDKELDNIVRKFFCKVDPRWWAEILTFALRELCYGDGFEYLLDHRPTFGSFGRACSGSREDIKQIVEDQIKQEQGETVNLALRLFPGVFLKRHLEKWLGDLDLLDDGVARRNKLRNIFEALNKAQE
jgi:hypothetical protein